MTERHHLLAALVLAALLIGFSARTVLGDPLGLVWGNHADTVHHVWGQWWSAETEGPYTTLVSFPSGEMGSILAPVSTALLRPVHWVFGPIAAYNLLNALHLLFAAVAAGLCAHRLTGQAVSGAVAGLALLVGRSLYLHIGSGNTEGLAVGWLLLAAWLGIDWLRGRRNGLLVGLVLGIAVLENPYALLPGAALAIGLGSARLWKHRDWKQLIWATIGGLLPTLSWLLWVGEGLGGNRESGYPTTWLGVEWTVYDWPYSAHLEQLVSPWPMLDLSATPPWLGEVQLGEFGAEHTMLAGGGGIYLGLVPLALALWAGRRAGWPLLMAAGCLLMAAGSLPWALSGGPFLFVNDLLGTLGMPLSQPLRFVPLAACGLSVAAGVGAARLPQKWIPAVLALLAVEGLTLGGPALRIPVLSNSATACMAGLSDGAVHMLTPPRIRPDSPNPQERIPAPQHITLQAMLLQLHHEQPSTHAGIGGWKHLAGDEAFNADIDALNELATGSSPDPAALSRLESAGLEWLVVADGQEQDWMPAPTQHCGGWRLYPLSALR